MSLTLLPSASRKLPVSFDSTVPITELSAGEMGRVVVLDGESSLRQHLLEMGFTKGTTVEFVRQAPLGDPIDLRLRGYRLSLRRAEAAAIVVERI